jgi:hypothetical protein
MIGRPTLSDSMPLFYKGLSGRCTTSNRCSTARCVGTQWRESSSFDPAVNRHISPAAFPVPAPFTFGTAARSYTGLRAAGDSVVGLGVLGRRRLGRGPVAPAAHGAAARHGRGRTMSCVLAASLAGARPTRTARRRRGGNNAAAARARDSSLGLRRSGESVATAACARTPSGRRRETGGSPASLA